MRKSIVLLMIASLAFDIIAKANPVDVRTAQNVGTRFLAANTRVSLRGTNDLQLVTTYTVERGNAAFYVFNAPSGFVIVSADDCAYPILGYSDEGRQFDPNNIPIQLQDVLQEYVGQIQYAIENNIQADEQTARQWRLVETTSRLSNNRDNTQVGPLLTTTWGQGPFYNALCPEDPNGPDGHAVTGCVATAMAQIISYYQYPTRGRGIHSYNTNYYGGIYGTLTVNYENEIYDYTNMPDALAPESSDVQINAVAQLMRDCGVAVNMMYSASESNAMSFDIRGALTDYFLYSPQLKYSDKQFWPESDWLNVIKNNLIEERPILYSGRGNQGGHLFVCDGYNNDKFLHFNFGWSGSCDGWYQLSAITPNDTYDFSSSQAAIFDIIPDEFENSTLYAQQSWGQHSTFYVSEPIDLLGVLADNQYPFQGGFMYNNGHTFTFIASDTTKQLVLYVMDDVTLTTYFYDGPTTEDPLIRSFVNYAGHFHNLDITPIITSNHVLTIELESAAWDYGNHFLIAEYNGCDVVTGIDIEINTTSAHLSWGASMCANQWEIEYGYSGFAHGEGTIINTNLNHIDFDGLTSFKEYDFYIRPICENNVYGYWSRPVTAMIEAPLWTDVVNEQPEGYEEDSLGNVTISTAEGLAWLSIVSNGVGFSGANTFEGKTVQIIDDINMGDYIWRPIENFKGILNGNGHIVDSLFIISHLSSCGLIDLLDGGTVKNVNLINCYVNSNGSAAGIASGASEATIYNCFVRGIITSNGYAAGIIAYANHSEITNCAVNGHVTGVGETSGVCCVNSSGVIRNCYSSASITAKGVGAAGVCSSNPGNSEVSNCYANYYRCGTRYIAGQTYEGIFYSLAYFEQVENDWVLIIDDENVEKKACVRLLDALNDGVEDLNLQGLRYWVTDTVGYNESMPILGDLEYQVTCPNVSNVSLQNIDENNELGISVLWQENGEAEMWEIRCLKLLDQVLQLYDTIGVFTAYNNPYTLWGLTEGETYTIQVRPVCDSNHHGAWSERKTIVFDKPYWNEIVTTQPEGYVVEADGNVSISSAEGLAWLISVVNGENGQDADNMQDKSINLACDVNIGQYKWRTMHGFGGSFNGNGHLINGLYINETTDNQGFFANTNGASIVNVVFENARVIGHNNVATVCGGINNELVLSNCKANCIVTAYQAAGGIVSSVDNPKIDNCSSSGNVSATFYGAGGIAYQINGNYSVEDTYFRNCYSQSIVSAEMLAGCLIGGNSSGVPVVNSYAHSSIACFFYGGGIIGGTGTLNISNCYTTLNVPEGSSYLVNDQSPVGVVVGVNSGSLTVNNVYYPRNHGIPVVGTHEPQEQSCILIDTMGFDLYDAAYMFDNAIVINNTEYTDLLSALNAWVDANNTEGQYLHWVADTAMVNGGFPMLEQLPITTTQTSCLTSGWNWWAPMVQTTVDDLEAALGGTLVQVKPQDDPLGEDLAMGEMYRIQTSAPCNLTLTGIRLSSATVSITNGPSWFGYTGNEPVAIATVFDSTFGPTAGDKIISQDGGFSIYNGTAWEGTLTTLQPGHGYVYVSNASGTKTVVFE